MTLSIKNKKKLVTSAIAVALLLALISVVVFALVSIRDGLAKTVGALKEGSIEVHFDLQKADELGIKGK